MSTLTLRVPDELDQALERQSAALGVSKSDLAREALKRYLRVAEFRACAPDWSRARRRAASTPMRTSSRSEIKHRNVHDLRLARTLAVESRRSTAC